MRSRSTVALLIALFGCSGSPAPAPRNAAPAPAQPDCAGAVSALPEQARGGAETRCKEDAWTAAATSCLANAANAEARGTCMYNHFTRAQQDRFDEVAGGFHEAMAAMTEFRNQMCACKDAKCAEKVSNGMVEYAKAHANDNYDKMTEAQLKRATEIGTAMSECMTKAMGMGGTP